jgi:hypothetical protein
MSKITKEFKIKNTNVRLFDSGTASITGPDSELDYINQYLRLEDYIKLDALVLAHSVVGLHPDLNADLT